MQRIVSALLLALALTCAHAAEKAKPGAKTRPAARAASEKAPEKAPALPMRQGLSAATPLYVRMLPPEPTPEEKARRVEEQQDRAERQSMDRRLLRENQRIANYTYSLAIAASALLAMTLGLLGMAVWQARELRRTGRAAETAALAAQQSLVLAEQSSQRQLRAYVLLLQSTPEIQGQDFVVNLVFKNHGQTPAYNVRSSVQQAIWKVDEPFQPAAIDKSADNNGPMTTLGPGAQVDKECRLSRPLWQLTLLQELESGITRGYVYGKIFYTDAFEQERTTTFQLQLGRDTHGRWVLLPAPGENTAT